MKLRIGEYEVRVSAFYNSEKETDSFLELLCEYAQLASKQLTAEGFTGMAKDAVRFSKDINRALSEKRCASASRQEQIEQRAWTYLSNDATLAELVDLHNEWCERVSQTEMYIARTADMDNELSGLSASEIIGGIKYGEFSEDETYFYVDPQDGAFYSFSEENLRCCPIDIIKICDYAVMYHDCLHNDTLSDIFS